MHCFVPHCVISCPRLPLSVPLAPLQPQRPVKPCQTLCRRGMPRPLAERLSPASQKVLARCRAIILWCPLPTISQLGALPLWHIFAGAALSWAIPCSALPLRNCSRFSRANRLDSQNRHNPPTVPFFSATSNLAYFPCILFPESTRK